MIWRETDEDREREGAFAGSIGIATGWILRKVPDTYGFDFAAFADPGQQRIIAVIECKQRNNSSTKYDPFIIDSSKLFCLLRWAAVGVPAYIAVRFTDIDMWHRVARRDYHFRYGGRNDRDDENDLEPMVEIPMSMFAELQ